MRRISFLITSCLLTLAATAQETRTENWCSSDEHLQNMLHQNPDFAKERQAMEGFIQQFASHAKKNSGNKKVTIIIPVVVHNITHDGGKGYVSKTTIEGQLKTLNEDFNRLNADTSNTRPLFAPYAGSVDIEFRLAHIDPNGDCTEGIVRAESHYSFSTSTSMAENVKSVSQWPVTGTRAYFNIWVIDEIQSNGNTFVAGYAQFPGSNNNGTYGVVMANQSFGPGHRTLTHELGHCLNLYHTFNYGSCNSSNDQCGDTPTVYESKFDCDVNRNSCTNFEPFYGADVVDQFENYMSYANCQNMFTQQQVDRVNATLSNTNTNQGLAHLYTPTNLANTGVANPYGPVICTPIAEFSYDNKYVCEGDSITYTDASYNATPTSWNWTFNGGTPFSSTDSMPTIHYDTVGVYDVTHRPGTTAGTDVIIKPNLVTVSSLTAAYSGNLVDDFENATQFANDWIIEDPTGSQTWEHNSTAAVSGIQSVRIQNRLITIDNSKDLLISPSYDVSALPNKVMSFKVAYARKDTSSKDKLLVYWSTNCGKSWQLKKPLTAYGNLPTAPDQFSMFIPNASQWVEHSIDLSPIANETNVRFKFEFTSLGGNDIYLDDINVGNPVGIDENSPVLGSFNVFPNPTTGSARVSFELTEHVNVLSIQLKNSLGQQVSSIINGQSFEKGKYTLSIDEGRKVSKGIYFLEFRTDDQVQVRKLMIQ
ncbi:MAG: T9SS type A sorting domain-containing protein [Flavobacteriales bacterium]|nr:T9SS type A sorting domain-containing protein [Flavobacteriales bacterium]